MSNNTHQYKVIGLMSGTSLDGLDIAFCNFQYDYAKWSFTILDTKTIAYSQQLKNKLQQALHLDATELLLLHNEYGHWLGTEAKQFIAQHNLAVDFIASHGHTIFHQPDKGLTYQIGSGQHLANASNKKVICDFRTKDVALGGQGAPLVPIGDRLLFSKYDFCLNLGGFSNISFEEKTGKRIAFDISPVNMLLNYLSNKIDLEYDKGGNIAQSGTLNLRLLDHLNKLEHYNLNPPKSLGQEWFTQHCIPLIESTKDTVANLLHTSTVHIAHQIGQVIKSYTTKHKAKVFITGGGAKNNFLITTIKKELENLADVITPNEKMIDFKEALVFAFLGVLRDRNEVNCLQSVTGATKDSSSGVIYYP
ncbi:anhydro-N-acetylmuramic acid kinase [Aquimarina brevivitae]|uniref:Anhydro-N-acetylmuramic acid kinase n=1 Tax=Aquimarina brevivitae TaxID=323412 RepID=A0A4Q7P0G9_9FLAO|nr:anhydro-N-acetylmuramic acid kinase [Aquimarina brevivitae]RZS93286.1 anhydro-N-acetylmuramic acid kinase [Aquimarina brevivitae]